VWGVWPIVLVLSHILPLHSLLYPAAALSPVYCHTVERVVVAVVIVVAVSGREMWKEAKGAQLELIVKSSRTEEEVTLFRVLAKARVPCSPSPPSLISHPSSIAIKIGKRYFVLFPSFLQHL